MWTINVLDAATQATDFSYTGTGVSIDQTFNPQTAAQSLNPPPAQGFTYQVTAVDPVDCVASTATADSLSIDNLQANPDEFAPDIINVAEGCCSPCQPCQSMGGGCGAFPGPTPGEATTTDVTGNINGHNFTPTNPSWSGTIAASDGTLVKHIPVTAGATIAYTWDGSDDSGAQVPPDTYTATINATCSQGFMVMAMLKMTLDSSALLQAKAPDPETGKVTVWGDSGILLNIGNEPPREKALLNNVFPAFDKGANDSMTIVAQGLRVSPDQQTVSVHAATNQSDPTGEDITLNKVSDGSFQGTLSLHDVLNGQLAPYTFTSTDASDGADPFADSDALSSILSTAGSGHPPMGSEGVSMGRAEIGADPTQIIGLDFLNPDWNLKDIINSSYKEFQASGYEVLRLTMTPPSSSANASPTPMEVDVRVKNQANVIYYSGHGYNTGFMMVGGTDPKNVAAYMPLSISAGYNPDLNYLDAQSMFGSGVQLPGGFAPNLTPTNWDPSRIQALIIAGCSLINIDDYNNKFPRSTTHIKIPDDWDTAPQWSPGLRYYELTNGNTVLLGYNWEGPAGGFDTRIITDFLTSVFQSNGGPPNYSGWPMQWINSNLKSDNDNDDTECAIYQDEYYFIKYEEPKPVEKYDFFGRPYDLVTHKNRFSSMMDKPGWYMSPKDALKSENFHPGPKLPDRTYNAPPSP
jgi:hypothetical protein